MHELLRHHLAAVQPNLVYLKFLTMASGLIGLKS